MTYHYCKMNNYIKNLKKYTKRGDFFEGDWYNFKEPFNKTLSYKNSEDGMLYWLKEVAKYHTNENTGSPYWVMKAGVKGITPEKIDDTTNLDELVSLLGNSDLEFLKRDNGYKDYYMPKNLKLDDMFRSSSSGTTGPAKTVYHTPQSLLVSAINEYTGLKAQYPIKNLKNKKLLAAGPLGAYQEEHKKLAELLGMEYIGNGFETKGLKLLSIGQMKQVMEPIMKMEVDKLNNGDIGLATAAMEMLALVPKDIFYNADLIKVSGTQITADRLEKVKNEIGRPLIPMYGHYAGKSSIGVIGNYGVITYFPPFPLTYIQVSSEENTPTKMIVAEPELLIISDEDYASKDRTIKAFKPIEGISDLSRA